MRQIWQNQQLRQWRPNVWDGVAFALLVFIFSFLAYGAQQMSAPYHLGEILPIHLSIHYLPYYALRTVIRIFIAMIISLLFTFIVGTIAAKNKHAERLIIPAIDVLQSVPILGFLSISVAGFIALFPHSLLGPECAVIFVIFTSQVWNMVLGFYQSLKTLPYELKEVSSVFHLSAWKHFWRVEVPFALPGLIWNMMLSMSASWFFVVASEAISVNHQEIMLPGIGSFIAEASIHANKIALTEAIITMLIVILLYDQLLFRPLVAWSEQFKFESNIEDKRSRSWVLWVLTKTRLFSIAGNSIRAFCEWILTWPIGSNQLALERQVHKRDYTTLVSLWLYYGAVLICCSVAFFFLGLFILHNLTWPQIGHVLLLGVYTMIRVFVSLIICSIIWVPLGVLIGLNAKATAIVQPIAQFLASFPANLLFPIVVMLILKFQLNVEVWLTPLMILGAQWYILFNVIAGAASLPKELILATRNFHVQGWLWWRRFILPGILPFYITGAMTAAGGAWNVSIVTEIVNWGSHTLRASGLGAYITTYTNNGDFPRIVLGISVMCLYVLLINRLLWQPMYHLIQKRFQQ